MKKLLSFLLALILLSIPLTETIFAIDYNAQEPTTSTASREAKIDKKSIASNTIQPRSIIHPTKPSITYRFYSENQELENDIQILTNEGGILFEPEIPELENKKFIGWFIEENGVLSDKEIKFVEGVAEIEADSTLTTDKDINVVAKFEDNYHISFMQQKNNQWIVAHKIFGKPGDVISTKNIPITLENNQSVEGWYDNAALSGSLVGDTVTLENKNLTLYPKIVEGHFITYHVGQDSLSHIETQFYKAADSTIEPTTKPTRIEYTFKHWSTTKDGEAFTFGNTLDKNIDLYAVWEESNIPYTVSIWTQSVDDDKDAKDPLDIEDPNISDKIKTYNVSQTLTRSVSRADVANYKNSHPELNDLNEDVIINNYIASIIISELKTTNQIPEGFHYVDEDIEILPKFNQPRNATILLDRNLMTINLKDSSGSITQSFTGLYGQTLSKYGYTWPQGDQNNYREEFGDKRRVTLLDSFRFSGLAASQNKKPNDTLNLIFSKDDNLTKKIVHYKEELDGSYKEHAIINTRSDAGFTITDKYPGFLAEQYKIDSSNDWRTIPRNNGNIDLQELSYNSSLEIRHKRQNFKISFTNNGIQEKSISIPYEKNISESINSDSNLKSYIEKPTQPKNIPDNFIFKGWFLDETGVEDFNFNKSMPRVDLVAFGLWVEPTPKVRIFENKQSTNPMLEHTVTYNSTLTNNELPTVKNSTGEVIYSGSEDKSITIPKGYTWVSWLVKENGVYRKFANEPIIKNTDLYPYYTNNTSFTVTYYSGLDENGQPNGQPTGKNFTSGKTYAYGTTPILLDHKEISNPHGKYFIGWKNIADGKLYHPGDTIEITDNISLVAQWSDKISKVKVVYRSGLSGDSEVIKEKLVNEKIYLEKPIFKKDGLKFIGWKNLTDNKIYEPNSILQVNRVEESSQNILVAQWVKELTLTKKWVNGESKRPENITLILKRATDKNSKFEEFNSENLNLIKADNTEETIYLTGSKISLKNNENIKSVLVNPVSTDGTLYNYNIDEIDVPNFKKTIEQDKLTITNTYIEPKVNKPDIQIWGTNYPRWETSYPKLDRKNHFAYIIGYPDSSFRPQSNITRAEMTTIFSRLLEEKIILPNNYKSSFSDVLNDSWYSNYIGKLTQVGVISGYPDGTFKPDNKVTRAEFAAIASRFIVNKKTSSNFSDVSNNYWASESIEYVKAEGWINGYPDGSFRPENNITRAEVVNIVNLMLDRYADKVYVDTHLNSLYSYTDLPKNHWAYYPIMEASNGHIYHRLPNNEESWIRHWTPEEQENFSKRWR